MAEWISVRMWDSPVLQRNLDRVCGVMRGEGRDSFPTCALLGNCCLCLSLQPSFFVVYNMVTTEVIAVFENTSDELLELFENFCDLFRNATLHSEAVQFPCSASSNNFARQIQRR